VVAEKLKKWPKWNN